jgi:thiamine biosynthesis lipoprotein
LASGDVIRRFRSLGCHVVVGGGTRPELEAVERLFAERESVFDCDNPDSELSRLNRADSDLVVVSPLLARALRIALSAARQTGGLVDPTIGADWRAVHVTPSVVGRPPGVTIDLTRVARALAVDEGLGLLRGPGFVSTGGALAARGAVVAGLPGDATVRVVDSALATRSGRGGACTHVTASGRSCLAADVAARAAFLLGPDGPDWLDDRTLPGRFVDERGEVVENGCWLRALGAPAA